MDNGAIGADIADKSRLSMQAVFSDGTFAWVSEYSYNCLVQVEEKTNTIIKADPFIEEDICESPLHKGAILYKNRLIFYPNRGKGLNIVDTKTGEQDYISLEGYIIKANRCKFSTVVLQGNILWLIPQDSEQQLLNIDMEKRKVSIQPWWNEALENCGISGTAVFFGTDLIDNELLVSVRQAGFFLRCSLENRSLKKVTVNKDGICLHRVYAVDRSVWCTCYNSTALYIASPEGDIRKLVLPESGECEPMPYSRIVSCEGKVIVIPRYGEKVLIYDYSGEPLAEVSLSYHRKIENRKSAVCNFAAEITASGLILYPNYDGVIKIIDLEAASVAEHEYKGRDILYKYYVSRILPVYAKKDMLNKGYISENADRFSLNEYIRFVSEAGTLSPADEEKEHGSSGQYSCAHKIINAIKEELQL